MKNRRPFSFILAVVLVVWLPVTMLLYRTLGHRAFQAYVTELRAKGEKLTFKELSASISLSLDDSLVRLTNAVRRDTEKQLPSTTSQKLALIPRLAGGLPFRYASLVGRCNTPPCRCASRLHHSALRSPCCLAAILPAFDRTPLWLG